MAKYKFHGRLQNIDFYAPASVKHKKYDAYINGKKYSFGDQRYEQYHDRIGYYSDLDHFDEDRRNNYIARHGKDNLDEISPGLLSLLYLW